MNPRTRRLAFIILVLFVQVACVIFYGLLTCNKQSEVRRNISERKASPGTKYTRKVKRDKKDDVIDDLQKKIANLREELNKMKKSCFEPTKSVPAATTRVKSHREIKGYPKDGSGYKKLNRDKEGHSRIQKDKEGGSKAHKEKEGENRIHKDEEGQSRIHKDKAGESRIHKEKEGSNKILKNKNGYNRKNGAAKNLTYIRSDWITDEVVFNMFTGTAIFGVKPIESPKKRLTYKNVAKNGEYWHLTYAMQETTSILKKYLNLTTSANLTLQSGLYRYDGNFGTEYDFTVLFGGDMSTYKVKLIRPLLPLILTHPPVKSVLNKLINIIVPLQGRLERFQEFLNNFRKVCILRNENVFLTVVYSGKQEVVKASQMLNALSKDHGFKKFKLVTRDENFNRGHALHDGVQKWKGDKDVLLFFCDVDIVFDSGFIDRCRTFAEPAQAVYYPIVFNLYNPEYVRTTMTNFWKISKNTGFWRYYGYGMTCQHRQDYLNVGGFDLNIQGWGSEDVQLHREYVKQPNIRIIRAPDKGLYHRYHTKYCDSTLPWKQYRSCLATRLDTEASKTQYGRKVRELEEKIKRMKFVKPSNKSNAM